MKFLKLSACLFLFINQVNAQSALNKVEKFLEFSNEIKQVWPGFIKGFHHAIYDKDGNIYLALDNQAIMGWDKIKTINNTPIFTSNENIRDKFKELFFIQHKIDNDILIDGAFNSKNAIQTLFHESFHGFQNKLRTAPETDWSDTSISDYIIDLKDEEFNILQGLLYKKKLELPQFKNYIVQYTSIRKYRESLMNNNSIDLERAMEWQEGVATYIGHNIKKIINADSTPLRSLLNNYGKKSKLAISDKSIENFMRLKAYYHGAAICYLLDNFKPNWKTEIEQGKTPFDLLEEIFPPVEVTQEYIENLFGKYKNSHKKDIKQEIFTKYKDWKYSLRTSGQNQSATWNVDSSNMKSYSNGTLIKFVKKIYSENENFSITGNVQYLFMNVNNFSYKIKKLPKIPKSCTKMSKTLWSCKAGTKIKISGLKIKIKKDMEIRFEEGIMEL